jgi:hypothetical protein
VINISIFDAILNSDAILIFQDWQQIFYNRTMQEAYYIQKLEHFIHNLYAELKKSSTYSHTSLGLNPQIGRPLSRIVGAIGLFFLIEE